MCPSAMAPVMSPTHCVAWQLFRISTLPLSSLTSRHGLMLPWQPDGYCSFLDSCTQCGKCQAKAGKQVPLHRPSGAHSLTPGCPKQGFGGAPSPGRAMATLAPNPPHTSSSLPSTMITEYLPCECQQETQIEPWLGLRQGCTSKGC